MESAGRKNRSWRVVGVGLAASLCLAAGALGSALAAPGDDDFKDNPGAISTEPLFPADDGPQPTAAQAELAARITAIQTNGGGDDPSKGSLPYQVAHGILGISGAPAKGYTVILAGERRLRETGGVVVVCRTQQGRDGRPDPPGVRGHC